MDFSAYEKGNPFMSYNHIQICKVDPDCCVVKVNLVAESMNLHGHVHGGLLYAMADCVAGIFARMDGRDYVTQSAHINFLHNVQSGTIFAKAEIIKRGKHMAYFHISITDQDDHALVSFSCAMQVQTFRKVNGYAFASTMCIGNMRSGMEALSAYIRTHDRNVLGKALRYWEIIFLFAVGAGIGGQFVVLFGAHTIWFSCLLLLVSFCLMFIREEMKEHPEISVEEETIQKDLWDIEKQIKNIGHQVGEDISVMKSPHNKDSQ